LYRDIPEAGLAILTVVDDGEVHFYVNGRRDVFRFGALLEARPLGAGGPVLNLVVAEDALARPVSRDGSQAIMLRPANEADFWGELAAHGLRPRDLPDIGFRVEAPMTLAANAVLTHTRAVQTEGVRRFVFVYDGGNLRRRYVDVGAVQGDTIQILAGLEPGQWVVRP
jgi:hypothetical protein